MAQPEQAETLSIAGALQWHEQVRTAVISDRRTQVQIAQGLLTAAPHSHLIGLTVDELHAHYGRLLKELEKLCCLNLLAAAEAILRTDYLYRAKKKAADAASVEFRKRPFGRMEERDWRNCRHRRTSRRFQLPKLASSRPLLASRSGTGI